MQSHMRPHCSYNCKRKIIFYLPQALSLLSLSSLHFFLLSSLSVIRRCGSPMSVLYRWLCSADGHGSSFDVFRRFYGSGFVGLSSWVWVRGSAFCGASTSRLAATIASSSCIQKETRKLCQGTSQSTSKSWTREALLRQNGTTSLAIASQSRMFMTIRSLFTIIPSTDSG